MDWTGRPGRAHGSWVQTASEAAQQGPGRQSPSAAGGEGPTWDAQAGRGG